MKKIAIIGAGIAGVTAAIALKEKGYQVQLFEKEARVGGKCFTYVHQEEDGKAFSFDMGATVVAISFKHLLSFLRKVQAPMFNTTAYEYLGVDGRTQTLKERYWSKVSFGEILRFVQHIYSFRKKHMTKRGYLAAIPDDYKISFAQFCYENDLEGIKECFDLPIAAWGYKNQNTLPAWYVFGEMDLAGFLGLLITLRKGKSVFVKSLSEGLGGLIAELVKAYNLEIKLDCPVEKIHRFEDQVILESSAGMESFDKVLISNPALISKLSNPTEAELAVLDELRYAPYATVLCSLDQNINKKLLVGPHLAQREALKMIAAPYQGLPYAICYVSINKSMSVLDVEELLMTQLGIFNIGLKAIHKTILWPNFFPHLDTFAAYEALLGAQGQNHTLYIGSINQFEFTEAVVSTTQGWIDSYFPNLIPSKKERFSTLKNWRYWFLAYLK